MPKPAQDPLGILNRIPELENLAERDKGVRRSIERGRAHALYRRLFWMNLLRKTGQDAELVRALLRNRRLFIEPLKGTPVMFTYNGVGTSIYGNDDRDPNDGSYAKTLFLVFFFVPLFPFGAYVVKDGSKSNSWLFMGRLPLGSVTYFWQRAVALGVLGGVLAGVFASLDKVRNNDVHLVNGLPMQVMVRVGKSEQVAVAPQSIVTIRSAVGEQEVEVFAGNRKIESGKLDVGAGVDVVAWNVLGVGAVYRETVQYVSKGSAEPSDDEPTPLCGESSIAVDDVDYVFRDAPSELSMPKDEKVVTKSRVGFERDAPELCFRMLAKGTLEEQSRGASMAIHYAEATQYASEAVHRAENFLEETGRKKEALKLASDALHAHEDSIEYHREYQAIMLAEGLRGQLLNEYEARYKKSATPDNAYLLSRLRQCKDSRPFMEETLKGAPEHPYLLRAAGYCARYDGDFARALELGTILRTANPEQWQEYAGYQIEALAALGRVPEARDLLKARLGSTDSDKSDRFELVTKGLLLSHMNPVEDPEPLLQNIPATQDKKLAHALELRARLMGLLPVTDTAIESVENDDMRGALFAQSAIQTDPQRALTEVNGIADESISMIPVDAWALLVAEAARTSNPALEKLVKAPAIGKAASSALVRYVREGVEGEDLDNLPLEVLAAMHFVRSRVDDVPERTALLERAKREDPLHGVVTKAIESWQK